MGSRRHLGLLVVPIRPADNAQRGAAQVVDINQVVPRTHRLQRVEQPLGIKAHPEMNNIELAKLIGVGEEAIRRVRNSLPPNGETQKRTSKDGKQYSTRKANAPRERPVEDRVAR